MKNIVYHQNFSALDIRIVLGECFKVRVHGDSRTLKHSPNSILISRKFLLNLNAYIVYHKNSKIGSKYLNQHFQIKSE